MSFSSPAFPRLTPWLGRLIAVTAVVQLLLETIFVSPNISFMLSMNPAAIMNTSSTTMCFAPRE